MNNTKSLAVDSALNQLAAEIAADKRYDDSTALLACSAIINFIRTANDDSKERLYDILKGATA